MGALKWGLRVLVFNCPQLPTVVIILQRKFPSQKGPKGHKSAQLQTIVRKLPRVALSPHLRAPIWTFPKYQRKLFLPKVFRESFMDVRSPKGLFSFGSGGEERLKEPPSIRHKVSTSTGKSGPKGLCCVLPDLRAQADLSLGCLLISRIAAGGSQQFES